MIKTKRTRHNGILYNRITLILKARLNPLAKNPPNGPITELNIDIDNE